MLEALEAPTKDLNDAVLELVAKEGPMKAKTILFSLLAMSAVGEFATAVSIGMLHADLLGRLESPDGKADSLGLSSTPVFASLTPEEARAYFLRKEIMTPAEFAALEDRYRAKGFSISGVHSRYVLETAYDAIGDSIAHGIPRDEVLGRINTAFADAGVEHPGDYQIATAVDTTLLGSYAAGRYEQMTDPDVLRARPFWEYDTVGDALVRPTHRAMNGRVFPADSEVWATWYPPNGFNCRCGVRTLSADEVKERGLAVDNEVPRQVDVDGHAVQMLPDPGFSGSPATQLTADRTVTGIRAEAARTGALEARPEDLDRAADVDRRRRVDRFAGLGEHDVEQLLRELPVFNAVHVETDADRPAPGELQVDWHMYSQNLDSAEQLVTRLVQTPGLYAMKDRAGTRARATYFAGWQAAAWPDPEVVYDDELARKLELAKGATVARSTEYMLRLRVTSPAELERVLGFLAENGERGPGKTPVRRAWEVQDVRVRAGHGIELPESKQFRRAIKNTRGLAGGRAQVTLTRAPLEGWNHEPVAVNASLWEFLP